MYITPFWEQIGVMIQYWTYKEQKETFQAISPKTFSVTYPDDFSEDPDEPSEEQPSNDKE